MSVKIGQVVMLRAGNGNRYPMTVKKAVKKSDGLFFTLQSGRLEQHVESANLVGLVDEEEGVVLDTAAANAELLALFGE